MRKDLYFSMAMSIVILSVALIIVSICAATGSRTTTPSTDSSQVLYPLTTVVVEIDEDKNEVVCLDFNGNEWVFEDTEDWLIGDYATLVLDENGTSDNIYDDIIVATYYNGWLDGSFGYDTDTQSPLFSIN